MVAENAKYWPEVLTVRDLINDGAIGDVITARAATFFPALGDFYGGDRPWRFDAAAAGGGVVIDTGSHWLRPLRVWLGEVREVRQLGNDGVRRLHRIGARERPDSGRGAWLPGKALVVNGHDVELTGQPARVHGGIRRWRGWWLSLPPGRVLAAGMPVARKARFG